MIQGPSDFTIYRTRLPTLWLFTKGTCRKKETLHAELGSKHILVAFDVISIFTKKLMDATLEELRKHLQEEDLDEEISQLINICLGYKENTTGRIKVP